MYESFYGLTQKPFATTPDPRYFFPSAKHEEALASLSFAVHQRKGFALITGETGTGKTMLSHMLLNELGDQAVSAMITNTHLSAKGLLQTICYELDLPYTGLTKEELMFQLNGFLVGKLAEDRSVVLVIDEAQNLTPIVLEEVRMLSNAEAESAKLLQIILVGQPALRRKLAMRQLEQLRQRVSITFHLYPLNREDTYGYIRHRLHVAGAEQDGLFTESALAKVFEFTRGIPRTVNILCDHAMLLGYIKESGRISGLIVDEAVYDLERGMQTSDSLGAKGGRSAEPPCAEASSGDAQEGVTGEAELEPVAGPDVCPCAPEAEPAREPCDAVAQDDMAADGSMATSEPEHGPPILAGPGVRSRLPIQRVDESVRQSLLQGSKDQFIQAALDQERSGPEPSVGSSSGEEVLDEIVTRPMEQVAGPVPQPEGDEMDELQRAIEEAEEQRRPQVPCLDLGGRLSGFDEVELGYSPELAFEEASRCLRCDLEE